MNFSNAFGANEQIPNSNNLLTNPKIAIDSPINILALRRAIFRTPKH